MPVRFFVELGARAIFASTCVPGQTIRPCASSTSFTVRRNAVARSWRSRRWRKRRMVVASGMRIVPRSIPANARYTGMSCNASRAASSTSENHCCRKWTRSRTRTGYGGRPVIPGGAKGGNPGDEGVPRDDSEHLLEEHLLARPLDGSFETVREAQLLHATIISATALAPLPFAITPSRL